MAHKLYRLDSTGHGLVTSWDKNNKAQITASEQVFAELRAKGFTMFALDGADTKKIMREFDPTETEILAVPQLVGG